MSHTHSVIMWRNQDGTTTLSQRYASGYHEPKLENAPPRVATIVEPSTFVVSSTEYYVVQTDLKLNHILLGPSSRLYSICLPDPCQPLTSTKQKP